MLTRTKIAVASLMLVASTIGASAQMNYRDYEPDGTFQGLWVPKSHPAAPPATPHPAAHHVRHHAQVTEHR